MHIVISTQTIAFYVALTLFPRFSLFLSDVNETLNGRSASPPPSSSSSSGEGGSGEGEGSVTPAKAPPLASAFNRSPSYKYDDRYDDADNDQGEEGEQRREGKDDVRD